MDILSFTVVNVNNEICKINMFLGIINAVIKTPTECNEAIIFHKDIIGEYKEKMIITYGM